MNKETYIAEAKEKRKKLTDKLALEVLAKMLKEDVCFTDTHYVNERTQEIIEKTIKKLKFSSEDIRKARKAFLDVLIDGAGQQLYGLKDDYEEIKKSLKIKSEKHKAKEALAVIERIESKVPQGLSEQRSMECEPICQFIASAILSKEFMLDDPEFVDMCIDEDNGSLMTVLSQLLFNDLFDHLITALDKSYALANEVNWGVPRHKIRMSQINTRLTK